MQERSRPGPVKLTKKRRSSFLDPVPRPLRSGNMVTKDKSSTSNLKSFIVLKYDIETKKGSERYISPEGPAKNNYLVQYAHGLSNMLDSTGLSPTAALRSASAPSS